MQIKENKLTKNTFNNFLIEKEKNNQILFDSF